MAKLPEFRPEAPSAADVAAMLSLDPGDVLSTRDYPQLVSCGLPVLYLFSYDTERPDSDLHAWRSVLVSEGTMMLP